MLLNRRTPSNRHHPSNGYPQQARPTLQNQHVLRYSYCSSLSQSLLCLASSESLRASIALLVSSMRRPKFLCCLATNVLALACCREEVGGSRLTDQSSRAYLLVFKLYIFPLVFSAPSQYRRVRAGPVSMKFY